MYDTDLLDPIYSFLQCRTPESWIEEAKKPENLTIILQDHLLCELKAAQSALHLLRKYAVNAEGSQILLDWFAPYEAFAYKKQGDLADLKSKNVMTKKITAKSESPYSQDLIDKMVLLIKEELHHFYQVLEIMTNRDIPYTGITASRYAKELMSHVITHEPQTLIDKLIIGSYIEARSCERFAKLAPYLDSDLERFYVSLLRSEARHYQDYLTLAQLVSPRDITDRINYWGKIEAELILRPDSDFKFHSGQPTTYS